MTTIQAPEDILRLIKFLETITFLIIIWEEENLLRSVFSYAIVILIVFQLYQIKLCSAF